MNKKIKEVTENWDKLPKAIDDKGEFVLIAEKDKSEPYEEFRECLGVRKNGALIWTYLSGCSCRGSNQEKTVTDMTAKTFRIEVNETIKSFYEKNKCEPHRADYKSY